MKKKGLSPVIASVLMILLVLVLAVMIFLWARGFISEKLEKFGRPVEEACESIDFRVEKVGSELEVLNRGNVDIWYLDVKVFKDGNSEIRKFDFPIGAGEAVKKDITFEMEDGSPPDETIVYPAVLVNVDGAGSSKVFTCNNMGVTL